MSSRNNHYNPKLKDFARQNRFSMTKAEACLWKYVLRAGQMHGFHFKRQRPILNYIADFVCLPLKLIIEVDGFSHQIPEISEKDVKRQQDLEGLGFTVLRFPDEVVLQNISRVQELISQWILENKGDVKSRKRGENNK